MGVERLPYLPKPIPLRMPASPQVFSIMLFWRRRFRSHRSCSGWIAEVSPLIRLRLAGGFLNRFGRGNQITADLLMSSR